MHSLPAHKGEFRSHRKRLYSFAGEVRGCMVLLLTARFALSWLFCKEEHPVKNRRLDLGKVRQKRCAMASVELEDRQAL